MVKETLAQKGFFGLYRGYSALLMFSIPKNYVRFGTYSYIKANYIKEPSQVSNFLCGMAAGAAEALFVVTPQETLKTKLIHDKLSETPRYRNLFHGIYSICQEKGIGGIYKAPVATVIKQSSNQGIRFVVYEDASKYIGKFIHTKILTDLLAGAFAGFCSTMANNPIDVVKTKMQGVDADKYKGIGDCFRSIWATQGLMGFYAGVVPRLARVILDVALTFAIFGELKRRLGRYVASKQKH